MRSADIPQDHEYLNVPLVRGLHEGWCGEVGAAKRKRRGDWTDEGYRLGMQPLRMSPITELPCVNQDSATLRRRVPEPLGGQGGCAVLDVHESPFGATRLQACSQDGRFFVIEGREDAQFLLLLSGQPRIAGPTEGFRGCGATLGRCRPPPPSRPRARLHPWPWPRHSIPGSWTGSCRQEPHKGKRFPE